MYRFWEYCFYRIARSSLLQEVEIPTLIYIDACTFTSLLQSANVLTVVHLFNQSGVIDIAITVTFLLVNLFVLNEKKYTALCEKYKEEANKRSRGIAVWAYVILSVSAFLIQIITKTTV